MFKKLPKWTVLPLFFSLLIVLSLLLVNLGRDNPSPHQFFTGSQNIEKQEEQEQKQNPLVEQIFTDEIPKLQGRWSVLVKDLKTTKIYAYNENETIASASVYKLTVMWTTFQELENGRMKLDDPIGNTNVEEALRLMIAVSDNDAAIALSEKIGWGKIHRLMDSVGIVGFDLITENGPYTTAKATADLLERIYKNTAVSPSASKKMLELLLAQKFNDRIPKYLPTNVKVAHKTGEIENFRHDAAIILGQQSDYIFVFLSETPSPTDATETIATLSKRIFDALEN
ncbi:serine hydrolase [Candidatus Curtissbacteria bacterium]|nr:serine hydrolase [Candidatus Curtissbacteria bacterium]